MVDCENTPYHVPALLPQCIEALDVHAGGVYVDCTYGGGGHSRAIADRLRAAGAGMVYAFDQDRDAIERALTVDKHPNVTIVYSNFRYIANFMRFYGHDGKVDGVLADLGVSFHHFDDPERGFSFRFGNAMPDMRMNRNARLTASDVLNTYPADRLAEIFRLYGEFGPAARLADAIVRQRTTAPFSTVDQLIDVVRPLISPRNEKKELACVFQALRIEVNDEIAALREMLQGALKVLRPGGRFAIITYHSLEDRLVKNFFKTGNVEGRLEKDFYGRVLSPLKPLSNKPIIPTEAEIEANPRCRSAKLRVAVKLETSEGGER